MIKAILIDPKTATIEITLLQEDKNGLMNAMKRVIGCEYLERIYTMSNGDQFYGDEDGYLRPGIDGFEFNGQLMFGKVCIIGVDEADSEGDCRSNVLTIGEQVTFFDATQVAAIKEDMKNPPKFSDS